MTQGHQPVIGRLFGLLKLSVVEKCRLLIFCSCKLAVLLDKEPVALSNKVLDVCVRPIHIVVVPKPQGHPVKRDCDGLSRPGSDQSLRQTQDGSLRAREAS